MLGLVSFTEMRTSLLNITSLAVIATSICLGPASQTANAKSPLGRRWSVSQRISMDRIDHAAFDRLLKQYVDRDGYVNYSGWQRSSTDRSALQRYLGDLSRADTRKSASRDARLAFWINAYNAVTIEGMLQVYPTLSIRNHTAKVFGYNIWTELPLRVGDATHSLNDIEHKILRKMGEPRIHFAIVCASVSCPRLLNEPYTAKRVQEQLAANMRDFFGRRQNFRVDASGRTIYMSSIPDWFGEDFGRSQAKRLAFFRPYLPKVAQKMVSNSSVRVVYLKYDWSLNDQSRQRKRTGRR
jgi:hypothetical protein